MGESTTQIVNFTWSYSDKSVKRETPETDILVCWDFFGNFRLMAICFSALEIISFFMDDVYRHCSSILPRWNFPLKGQHIGNRGFLWQSAKNREKLSDTVTFRRRILQKLSQKNFKTFHRKIFHLIPSFAPSSNFLYFVMCLSNIFISNTS